MSTEHTHETSGSTFKLGLILNTGFTVVEFTAGILTGSLALVADATHNLTDSLTLLISMIAEKISKRDATTNRTYGYGRATIIAALLNAGVLVAVALFIGYESLSRLNDPREIAGGVVALVASVGIVINGIIAWQLSRQKHDLNARSAYTNMLYDTLSSVGALIAGLAIMLTGWTWLDALVGITISLMLLRATIKIIRESLGVLLEGVPEDIDLNAVQDAISKTKGVLKVDDLHIWSIRSGYNSLSCHVIVQEVDLVNSRKIIESVKKKLLEEHRIQHATIEVELEDCVTHEVHEVL